MLAGYKIFEGITLQGALNSITVNRLDLVPGAIRISANVKGNTSLKVNDLNF